MNLLVYSHPLATNGDPEFGLPAFRNKLLKIAECAIEKGIEVTIAAPRHFLVSTEVIPKAKYIEFLEQDFASATGIKENVDQTFYRADATCPFVAAAAAFVASKIGVIPDVIIVWEAIVPHLRRAFPSAKVISLMPSPFSRMPYSDMIMVDNVGLYKDGLLDNQLPDILEDFQPSEKEVVALDRLRSEVKRFFATKDHFKDEILDLKNKAEGIESLTLLPLQISEHFAFKRDAEFSNQIEMLDSVLSKTPMDTGLLVTQYISKNIFENAIGIEELEHFQEKYKNFMYSKKFDYLHNISQYILPFVDNVTTFSSSLAFQGLLLEKKVEIIRFSYLERLFRKLEESAELSDKLLIFILFRCSVVFPLVLEQPNVFDWLLAPSYDGSLLDLPEYEARFFSGLRFESANKTLKRELLPWPSRNGLPRDVTSSIERADLVSFDIFDTLIERPLLDPKHLFHIVEDRLRADKTVPSFAFGKARIEAERIAHEELDFSREEVTLADIYDVIQRKYNLNDDEIRKIMDIELQMEREIVVKRPIGERIYNFCVTNKKKIIYTSDMYLDRKTIQQLLEKCNYSTDNNLYLSSEVGKKKKTGSVFPFLTESESVSASKIVHIGDNPIGDVASPAKYGIKTIHVKRAVDRLREHPLYRSLFGGAPFTDACSSAFGYLIARRLFDNPFLSTVGETFFKGNAYELGYCGLGPCVTDYAIWLDLQMEVNGNDHAFFIARDGRIIKEVFDLLKRSKVKTTYTLGSRRLLLGATVANIQEFFDVVEGLDARHIGEVIFGRFGHRVEDGAADLKRLRQWDKIAIAKSKLPEFFDKVEQRKELLHRYCEDIGMTEAQNPCVVDIGYAARIQEGYQRITQKPISGYYMILLDTARPRIDPNLKMRGYTGDFAQRFNFWHPLTSYSSIFETLFCSDEDTIVGVSVGEDGKIAPLRDAAENDRARKALVREVHKGARDFARDFAEFLMPIIDCIHPNPEVGTRVLKSFLENPTEIDALILKDVAFENEFTKSKVLYVIPPQSKYKKYSNGKYKTIWKQGSRIVVREYINRRRPIRIFLNIISASLRNTYIHIFQKPLKVMVRPFVRGLGNASDLRFYEENPSFFFAELKNPFQRMVGKILFPPIHRK